MKKIGTGKFQEVILGLPHSNSKLQIGQQFSIFRYYIEKEIGIENLHLFATHRRLQVFNEKGCKCVACGEVGTRLIIGRQGKYGNSHIDLYTVDLIPITVDHIVPLVKGGSDCIDNKQPMCAFCNNAKGDENLSLEVIANLGLKKKQKYLKNIKNEHKKLV